MALVRKRRDNGVDAVGWSGCGGKKHKSRHLKKLEEGWG
jgi:hypothetical protein